MGRIRLIIADTDEAFVESLVNYLMVNYSKRFQINSFTKQAYLINYLTQNTDKADILLISPRLYSEELPTRNVDAVVLLVSGKMDIDTMGLEMVSKYQHADKLIGQITDIFTQKSKGALYIPGGNKQTKVIGVYSPSGGTGKTSIALGSCVQYAQSGAKVFYLNLENINSTTGFLNIDREHSLSKIFYYIKEKNKNLTLKIESTRCMDHRYHIDYFTPPDSTAEIEEMLPEELAALFQQFKQMGQYDAVYVDMSGHLDNRNIAILEECDEVILVLTQESMTSIKLKNAIKDLDTRFPDKSSAIIEKAIPVVNKYNPRLPAPSDETGCNFRMEPVKLQEMELLKRASSLDILTDTRGDFGKGILELNGRLFRDIEASGKGDIDAG